MFSNVVILCSVAACVLAAPSSAPTDVIPLEKQQPTVIPIVSQSEELEPNGTYKFSYETGNGIKREETSYDKVIPKAQGRSADSNEGGETGESDEIHVQQGSYSYTAPDGTVISVRYIADENGFQPIGDHIPRVPAPSQDVSSSGRSSKALNVADSTGAGSAPVVAAKSAAQPESLPEAKDKPKDSKPEEAKPEEAKPDEAKPEEAKLEEAKPEEAKPETKSAASTTAAENESTTAAIAASTTEAASEATESASTQNASEAPAEPSTTDAPKSSEEPIEAASTEAPKAEEPVSTEAPKAVADASTVAAESTPASAEASTTESATTEKA